MKRLDLDILLQEGEVAMLEYKESLSASAVSVRPRADTGK